MNVLEHIHNDTATIAALRARLKIGGRLLIYVPAFPLLYTSVDRKVRHVRRNCHGQLGEGLRYWAVEHISYRDALAFLRLSF